MSQRANTTLALSVLALVGIWLVSETSQPPDSPPLAPAPAVQVEPAELPGTAAQAPSEPSWLKLSHRPRPRRLPSRPSTCTSPPPGGAWQVATIEATRKHACGEALGAWGRAMEVSEDHCSLARTVWLCFNEAHQRPLEGKAFRDFEELVPWLVHLESQPQTRTGVAFALDRGHTPSWSWLAPDGLERRLEAFATDEVLQESVIDLFGEGTVTDHLATDLLIEAEIAAALARVPPAQRSPYLEEVWARRVYVVTEALYGPAGVLLQRHRKDLYPELRRLAEEAVADAPETVRKAYAVARRDEALTP